MTFIEYKCKNCGSSLQIDFDNIQGFCQYCGAKLLIDIDNLDELLIEKEKTKQARESTIQEQERSKQAREKTAQEREHTLQLENLERLGREQERTKRAQMEYDYLKKSKKNSFFGF